MTNPISYRFPQPSFRGLNAIRHDPELCEITAKLRRELQPQQELHEVQVTETLTSFGSLSDSTVFRLSEEPGVSRQDIQNAIDHVRITPVERFTTGTSKPLEILGQLKRLALLDKKIHSYSEELIELAEATGGLLTIDEVYSERISPDLEDDDEGVESPSLLLQVVCDSTLFECPMCSNRDDVKRLVWFANQIVAHLGDDRRFHAFEDGDGFYAVFVTNIAARLLVDSFGLVRDEQAENWIKADRPNGPND